MAQIVVATPFTLTLSSGEAKYFAQGVHKDIPDEVADHWFTKPHLAKDGHLAEVDIAAPLTHQERVAMKAELDAANDRAAKAEADLDKAKSRIADLESDLDKATKPAEAAPAPKGK